MRDGIFVGGIYLPKSNRCNTFLWSKKLATYSYLTSYTLRLANPVNDQGTGKMALVSPAILAFWSE